MSYKRAVLLGALGSLPLLFAGLREIPAAGDASAASAAEIRIENFSYSPPTLIVAPGTTVTWKNDDVDVHTVIEKGRNFKSAALDTDDTFSQIFTVPGEYQYFCSLHPQMVGRIVVVPAGSS
jgi:plastocyanin